MLSRVNSFYLSALLFIISNIYFPYIHAIDFVDAGPPVFNIEKIGKNKLNDIKLIMQDSSGFIWLVKKDGLFRYDSKELRQFPGLKQFSSDSVKAVVEGKSGHIWIATKKNGLVHFNTYTTELTFYNLEEKFDLPASGNKADQLRYKNNTLYLASKNQLLLIDDQSLTVKKRYSLPIADSDWLMSMMVDSVDNIWFSSLSGNGVFLLKNDEIQHYPHDSADTSTIGSKLILTAFEDNKGRIWFGSLKGLSRYLPENGSFINFQPIDMSLKKNKDRGAYANVLTSIVEDPQGILWLGLYHGGLFNFDPETSLFNNFPRKQGVSSTILDNSIGGGLFMDEQQTLWVLNRKGISQLDKNNRQFTKWVNIDSNSNNDCSPSGIHDFNDSIYFFCFNTLKKIDDKKVTHLVKIKNKISNISHASDNLVWLGTMGGGVYRHNFQTKQTKQYLFGDTDALYVNSVLKLQQDVNNTLYGITMDHPKENGSGLIRYDISSDNFVKIATGLELVDFIDIDADKMLLITLYTHSEQGLYWFDKRTQQTTQLPFVTGEIIAALKWRNTIWLSTKNLGLITLDANTGEIEQFTTNIVETINGLYLDDSTEKLYLSTAEQLYLVDEISTKNLTTLCITCNLNVEYSGINHLGAGQLFSSNSALLAGGRFFLSTKNELLSIKLNEKKPR